MCVCTEIQRHKLSKNCTIYCNTNNTKQLLVSVQVRLILMIATGRQYRWCIIPHAATHRSSVLEDGQNNCPKHVVMTGIINKPLFLHLVGCLYYLYQ